MVYNLSSPPGHLSMNDYIDVQSGHFVLRDLARSFCSVTAFLNEVGDDACACSSACELERSDLHKSSNHAIRSVCAWMSTGRRRAWA